MKYTVVWVPAAEAEIARLWIEAEVRQVVAAAVDAMDHTLRRDPNGAGESRDGGERILLVWPLAITYAVSEEDFKVQVFEVWRYDQ